MITKSDSDSTSNFTKLGVSRAVLTIYLLLYFFTNFEVVKIAVIAKGTVTLARDSVLHRKKLHCSLQNLHCNQYTIFTVNSVSTLSFQSTQ